MSLSAAVLDALAESGVSREQIIAAVKADIAEREAEVAAKLEAKRTGNRERQQRKRAKGHAQSRDVTPVTRDPAPNERDILTPTRENPEPNGSVEKILDEEKLKAVGTCLKKAFPPVEIPEWMPASFAEFRAMRKAMRNVPFGEGAERRVIAKITSARAEGHDPEKLLSKAIENGHRTVFPDENTRAAAGQVKQTPAEQISNLKRAIELYSRTGRRDLVSDARKRIEELEGGRPPPQVAQFARGLRA